MEKIEVTPINPELKKISKLHLLVHPGFLTDRDIESSIEEEDIIVGSKLLESYIKKAESLGPKEVMIIITPLEATKLKPHIKLEKPWTEGIRKIKSILGDRAIVFGDKVHYLSEKETQDKLKKILAARGYFFDEGVLSEAYGETLEICLSEAAHSFNKAAGLKDKTVVKTDLTDRKGKDLDETKEIGERWEWNRLEYE